VTALLTVFNICKAVLATRQNEVSWTAAPLESLMNVDSIVDGWRSKGMTVHKVCSPQHLVTIGCS